MKKVMYTRANCPACPMGYNKGETVEWKIGYELTGTPSARNNKAGYTGGDINGWQVKSPKASLTEADKCDGYIFGFADAEFFYEMSKEEFESFILEFSYLDRDSKSGKAKLRIKNDTKKMRAWLEAKA